MSDSKQVQEKWRAEELRAQRKARLARMKAKDGGKKPIRTSNPAAWIITAVILVVALLLTGLWAAVRVGMPQRGLTAITVAGEKIKAVEIDYYYRSLLSNYSIDITTTDGQSTLSSDPGIDGYKTVADYLKDQAAKQVQQYVMLAQKATADGMALNDADLKQITTYVTSLESTAASKSLTLDNYLIATYGSGMTQDSLTQILKRYLLSSNYTTKKTASFTFTPAELETAYEASKDDYDVVNYRTFYLAAESKTSATDAEKTKYLEAARVKAEEMLAKISDGASFRTLCTEYAATADLESYKTTDKSLSKNVHKADLATDQASWLFDAARVSGDKTILESTSGYYILYFDNRTRANYQHVAIRHILISAATASATETQIAAAKTKAEKILADYKAGAKTAESFGELAKANSADSNASEGGLYDNVYPGEMVAAFNDWCFDSSRKTGDTGIVQTSYGFHVMYFVGNVGADWELSVTSALQSTAYSTYINEELVKYPYTTNSLGMRFVG